MKIVYFDCFSGISGDMVLGALVDAGVDPDALNTELAKLKLDEFTLRFEKATKHSISGTWAVVETTEDSHDHEHHDHSHTHGPSPSPLRYFCYSGQ